MSQSSFSTEEPTQASQLSTSTEQTVQGVETEQKRVHLTPELKLFLIRLCSENKERYLEEPTEFTFWQFITALFKEMTGHEGADLRKTVNVMVGDRKAALEARRLLSGVALRPATDLEQAIDLWIETCERRPELREAAETEWSAELKREKCISEVLRDNLTKRLSQKQDFRAVVEAREVVDLTAPGNVVKKRRRIREDIRANTNNTGSKEKMREDFSRLTDAFIDYMRKPSKCSYPESVQSSSSDPSKSSSSHPSQSSSSETSKLATEVANLRAKFSRIEANQESIKQLLEQLVKGKDKEQSA